MASGVAVLVGAVRMSCQQGRFPIRAVRMNDSSIASQMEKSGGKEVYEPLFLLPTEQKIHINHFIID